MSPVSPFSPDGMPPPPSLHQRHQSLQYPLLPHQLHQHQHQQQQQLLLQQPSRSSPLLEGVREVDEEAAAAAPTSKSASETPEPTTQKHTRMNTSESLQREVDEAEYHLEEQMRSQLDNDVDYSPHNNEEHHNNQATAAAAADLSSEARDPAVVQFAPQPPRFGIQAADGPVLHHPRPHSRGHSLSQKYFTEEDASQQNPFRPAQARS
ncbi:hypothetical protein VTK73DRAFT_5293 [Phialemonium thermophilum]|uniref:Uncharacterized protein n=1 Tax=Phialemonium thermophilum TaxID=223376 RepID=A0ABR3V265_9PEZI